MLLSVDHWPNYFARSLRQKRSMSVGLLVSEIDEGYFTLVMNGVEEYLVAAKYSYLLAAQYWKPKLMEEHHEYSTESAASCSAGTEPSGRARAPCLLNRINHRKGSYSRQVIVQPELIVRESTGLAKNPV